MGRSPTSCRLRLLLEDTTIYLKIVRFPDFFYRNLLFFAVKTHEGLVFPDFTLTEPGAQAKARWSCGPSSPADASRLRNAAS